MLRLFKNSTVGPDSNFVPEGSPEGAVKEQAPNPGPMVQSYSGLIVNSHFTEWPPEAPMPPGFEGLNEKQYRRISTISRRQADNGEVMAFQNWKKPDHRLPLEQRFGAVVDDLEPDAIYRVVIRATSLEATTVSISLYEYPKEGEQICLARDFLRIDPGARKQKYARKFRTMNGGRLKIVTHTNQETTYPARIAWHSIELREEHS